MRNKLILILIAFLCFIPISASGFVITTNTTVDWSTLTPYISQGDTVYVNSTIDISGVVPPMPYLAYWDGYDQYDENASYIINLPDTKKAYYHFYVDPKIFETRLGWWYKYDGTFHKSANDRAFFVAPEQFENSTMRYPNGTLINISTPIINMTPTHGAPENLPPDDLPLKHVGDYLLAIGDTWNITVSEPTNVWLFGRTDQILDYLSVNNTISISSDLIAGFEPGTYTLFTQTLGNESSNFTVKYDKQSDSIKWFDPTTFTIQSVNIHGLSAQVTSQKFEELIPQTHDEFKTLNFTLQVPSMTIESIGENPTAQNYTINSAGVKEYNSNSTSIYVHGYTNVAPGDLLTFYLDKDKTPLNTLGTKKPLNVITVTAEGNYGGDERWFTADIPCDKYDMTLGAHTVTGYTNLSDAPTTATFILYEAKPGVTVTPQPIRYFAGRNGPEEFVPLPTPIVNTVTVEKPVIQIQTRDVPVAPSNETVKEQQQAALNDTIGFWAIVIIATLIGGGILLYLLSLYLRRKECDD